MTNKIDGIVFFLWFCDRSVTGKIKAIEPLFRLSWCWSLWYFSFHVSFGSLLLQLQRCMEVKLYWEYMTCFMISHRMVTRRGHRVCVQVGFNSSSFAWKVSVHKHLFYLKGMYTIGNCQRPVFSLCVSHHTHNINKPMKIWAQSVIEVARKLWKKKHPCWTNLCAFR